MLKSLGIIFSERFRRWIPDPFVFAILLTLLVGILSQVFTQATMIDTLRAWYQGFWNLLEFGMQMILILVTGYAIALSSIVDRFVDAVAKRVNTPARVYFTVTLIGSLFALVSWGWIVLTAVLARELAHRVRGLDYAYLIACVYLSGQVWVGGLSSSIPLVLNTPGNFMIEQGVLSDTLATSYTLSSTLNFIYIFVFLFTFPILMVLISPGEKDSKGLDTVLDEESTASKLSIEEESANSRMEGKSLSDQLNHSLFLSFSIAIPGLVYIGWRFYTKGFDLDLNIMIFIFVIMGVLAHRTPMRYVIAMKRACSNISGIVFQYPFYAGIMGIILYTGLGELISNWMAGTATLFTLPLIARPS